MEKEVKILLSTYNGGKYLKEQLNSILNQDYKNISILVRDDGSTDDTIEILSEYSQMYDNIVYYQGSNIKPAHSFMDLIVKAPKADYYALADQDDVWLPDKISSAVSMLETSGSHLYHSNFQMVDQDLRLIDTRLKPKVETLGQSAVLITATGCTMVFTCQLRSILISYIPEFMIMHDYWILKVALCVLGPIVFDETPHILYRQHSSNVLGGQRMNFLKKWNGRIIDFMHPKCSRSKEFRELYKGFQSHMDESNISIVHRLAEYKKLSLYKRLKLAFSRDFKTECPSKNLLFKIAIILKKY